MKSPFFCAQHVRTIKTSESAAHRHWREMMRRGTQAYASCRVDAIYMYLGAAVDIALLRFCQPINYLFDGLSVVKPAEFLLASLLAQHDFDGAIKVLSRISNVVNDANFSSQELVLSFLADQYEKVEMLEKQRYIEPQVDQCLH